MIDVNIQTCYERIRITIINELECSTCALSLLAEDSMTGIRFAEAKIYSDQEYNDQKQAIEGFSNQIKTYLFKRLKLKKDEDLI